MESNNIKYFYFDIYSNRASFYYNNQEKIGSFFGLFLTILYILSSLIIFIYYLIIIIQRKELIVYDSSIYAQEMPKIAIDYNNLYFAFGLEDPKSSNRFIDETIYYPQILYIDRIKINGEFQTISKEILNYERCKEEKFGKNYQHFLSKGELNNSYCLKDYNYNLTFVGGFKYEKMTYIRIKIFPCKNTTENNNHCKPQELIDYYLTSGYFSILIKDFGLNPSNYTDPVLPTLQDLFTTIDKSLYRNLNIYFGITEIHSDIGFFNEKIVEEKYLQYRNNFQTFYFKNEDDYLKGGEICVIQLQLDDTVIIQTRKYTKLSEILSRIGGYMQLMYTIFTLLSLLINKFYSELKIINSIFNFNLKENKMTLKFKYLDFDSIKLLSYNKNLIFTSQKSLNGFNNNLNNNFSNLSLNNSNNKIINESHNNKLRFSNKMIFNFDKSKVKTVKINNNFPKYNVYINDDDKKKVIVFKDKININLFEFFFCYRKNEKTKKNIELYKLGVAFFRKIMDIVHVFTLLLITEKVLLKSYKQQLFSLYNKHN